MRAAKWRSMAHSRPTPSAARVPFPNSSMMQSDLQKGHGGHSMHSMGGADHSVHIMPSYKRFRHRALPVPLKPSATPNPTQPTPTHLSVLRRSMAATCVRSSMKALWGSAAASLLARRVKMRSIRPTRAETAGTKLPTCARKAIRATCRHFRENKAEAAN